MAPDADDTEGIRLQRVLAQRGWGSRRVCEELIEEGRVTVNGEVAQLGRRVRPEVDLVAVDGAPVGTRPDLVYYLLNKPVGVVSTAKDTHGRPTVVDLVPGAPRVYPVGRLDADSEGLLLLTNDGDLANRVAHPSNGVDKEYLVDVEVRGGGGGKVGDGKVGDGAIRRLRTGIELDEQLTAPARVSQPSPGVLRIVIHEGRNRQVRRMCDAVGHPVRRLVRTRIGPLRDQRLAPGEWRSLSSDELIALQRSLGSRKEAKGRKYPGQV